jgi:hypothetical protein
MEVDLHPNGSSPSEIGYDTDTDEATFLPVDQPSQGSSQPMCGRTKLGHNNILRPIQSPALCAETTTNITISCVICASRDNGHLGRSWSEIVVGRRAYACIKALIMRIKLKCTDTPLIEHLTLCPKCCIQLKLDNEFDEEDLTKLQGYYETSRKMSQWLSEQLG